MGPKKKALKKLGRFVLRRLAKKYGIDGDGVTAESAAVAGPLAISESVQDLADAILVSSILRFGHSEFASATEMVEALRRTQEEDE